MSIDFSTLQGLTIPEGVVTQIAKDGVVLWALSTATDEPTVILEVAKQTMSTYSGGTTYDNEEFVLLDIYPKKGGTVKVTYGGLTKTIKDTSGAEEPNAIQVFFGTFNGVSDDVETPASGTLTIEGAYRGYGAGSWINAKSNITYCQCITGCSNIGNPVYIGAYTFYQCTSLALTSLPDGITHIGAYAFYQCTGLTLTSLPIALKDIGAYAFYQCTGLTLTSLPDGVITVGDYILYGCSNITDITIPSSVTELGLRSLQCHQYEKVEGGTIWCDTNVKMLGTTPPTMAEESSTYDDSGAFGRESLYEGIITVPKGCGETYKSADVWNHYADEIVEAS